MIDIEILEDAQKVKAQFNKVTTAFNIPVYNLEPIEREFYGRFELAVDLLEQIELMQRASASDSTILEFLQMSLNSQIKVYGNRIQENANFNPDPED